MVIPPADGWRTTGLFRSRVAYAESNRYKRRALAQRTPAPQQLFQTAVRA
jgi:hypothetical protein